MREPEIIDAEFRAAGERPAPEPSKNPFSFEPIPGDPDGAGPIHYTVASIIFVVLAGAFNHWATPVLRGWFDAFWGH